ncbi:hypothetical protein [Holospora curviuscula]|uniref:YfdX protein n=1 Tax=Holospora curviuscula TaxID=1082868 RepID=A0A2S5R7W3_9PROT|nr:hypothetical protein [Holospora curviuscula]PPE03377.1 hypothetical protein HCUR_01171 [Holospora curviuscula]
MHTKLILALMFTFSAISPSFADEEGEIERKKEDTEQALAGSKIALQKEIADESSIKKKLLKIQQEKVLRERLDMVEDFVESLNGITFSSDLSEKEAKKELKDAIKCRKNWARTKAEEFLTLNSGSFDAVYYHIIQASVVLEASNRLSFKQKIIPILKDVLDKSEVLKEINAYIKKIQNNAEVAYGTVFYHRCEAGAAILQQIKNNILNARVESLFSHGYNFQSLHKALTPKEDNTKKVKKGVIFSNNQEGITLSNALKSIPIKEKVCKAALLNELKSKTKTLQGSESALTPELMTILRKMGEMQSEWSILNEVNPTNPLLQKTKQAEKDNAWERDFGSKLIQNEKD